jgi:hypothetical protein
MFFQFKLIQRKDAERYIQLSILGLAASVSLTRFILEATGYPQLGNETLHIAHCLYGGVILYIACLIPLIFSNKWAFTWSGILSGVGMGLFIDEVGKFMTQSNDYFFPAAAPIIYGFLLIMVLLYIQVARRSEPTESTKSPVEDIRLGFVTQRRLKAVLVAGLFIFGVGGCVRLVYYYSDGADLLETLLYSRISGLPNVSSDAVFLAAVQLWLEGLVGVLLFLGSILLVLGKESIGIGIGSMGLVISLVGVNLINFYIDQFGTIAKALIQYLLLHILYHYQRQFSSPEK